MAGTDMNDLFMYITDESGGRIDGESSLAIAKDDIFMKADFKDADYLHYANFFDVTDFDFTMELEASDEQPTGGHAGTKGAAAPATSGGGGGFDEWYQQEDPVKKLAGHFDVKEISGSIGKTLDASSPFLFQQCCLRKTFQKAVLVKRAFTGAVTASGLSASIGFGAGGASASASATIADGDSQAQGYLRLEMENVRITSVSWTDGDLVEEKLRFKCSKLTIKYRTQNDDGQLSKQPIELLKWEWTAGRQRQ